MLHGIITGLNMTGWEYDGQNKKKFTDSKSIDQFTAAEFNDVSAGVFRSILCGQLRFSRPALCV